MYSLGSTRWAHIYIYIYAYTTDKNPTMFASRADLRISCNQLRGGLALANGEERREIAGAVPYDALAGKPQRPRNCIGAQLLRTALPEGRVAVASALKSENCKSHICRKSLWISLVIRQTKSRYTPPCSYISIPFRHRI